MPMQKDSLKNPLLIFLLIGASLLLFLVFKPFFSLLALAAVFAILLHRPYEWLTRVSGGKRNAAAVITVALMFIFFIAPVFFLGTQIYQEAHGIFLGIHENGSRYLKNIQEMIANPMRQIFPGFNFDMNSYIGNVLVIISNNLETLLYQTFYVIFETFLMLFALFFFLRDGRELLTSFIDASPLGKETTRGIFEKMYQTVTSVMRGTLVNALIRWLGIWIAFSVFNIPNAILWSSIGGIVGAIPGLGTPFAFIPAIVYLYLKGNIFSAVGLALSGIIVIVVVDNILTSYFFGKGFLISPLFVLFSLIGGIALLGPLGFILGPLILSVFLSIVHVYGLERAQTETVHGVWT